MYNPSLAKILHHLRPHSTLGEVGGEKHQSETIPSIARFPVLSLVSMRLHLPHVATVPSTLQPPLQTIPISFSKLPSGGRIPSSKHGEITAKRSTQWRMSLTSPPTPVLRKSLLAQLTTLFASATSVSAFFIPFLCSEPNAPRLLAKSCS